MKLEDLLGLAIPVAFFLFWGVEAAVNAAGGGRRFETVRGWPLAGLVFFLILAAANVSVPLWLPPDWIARHRLMDLTGLGLWGAPVAYLAISLFSYLFHRAEHRFDVLWRGFHQLHHAVERVDIAAWAINHPLETVVFAGMSTTIGTFALGLDPIAVALAATVGTIITMFNHWNVPTPYWLGFILMRPEQHCLHHERGVHARNYGADIALWDLLFGSFRNVRAFDGEVGFGHSSLRALPAMLAFADVDGTRDIAQ